MNEAKLVSVVRELMEFIEENNISDEHHVCWVSDESCYVESDRSIEMKEILQKVEDVLGDE